MDMQALTGSGDLSKAGKATAERARVAAQAVEALRMPYVALYTPLEKERKDTARSIHHPCNTFNSTP